MCGCVALLSQAAIAAKPNIVILATGGTIAGAGASAVNSATYAASEGRVEKLIAGVPELTEVANVRGEQVFQIASESLTNDNLVKLAQARRRTGQANRTLTASSSPTAPTRSKKPLTSSTWSMRPTSRSSWSASMRPGTAMSADGMLNLYNAVGVAGSKEASGKGVLVTMNDEIHTGRDVSKMLNIKTEAFTSPWGPLGMVVEGKILLVPRACQAPHHSSEFDIDAIKRCRRSKLPMRYGNMTDVATARCARRRESDDSRRHGQRLGVRTASCRPCRSCATTACISFALRA